MQDQNILYKGVFDCLVKSAKKESVRICKLNILLILNI